MSQPENATAETVDAIGTVHALISSGRHPVSGRPGRAREDARAVEMGLTLAGAGLHLVHAGNAEEPALRDYLGMYHGLDDSAARGELSLLPMAAEDDAVPPLAHWLETQGARMVLTGQRAECGEGSGMLPYLLAERLGWSLTTGVAAIEAVAATHVTVLQALPQGQRRRLDVRLPCLIAVDACAPAPRQSAFGPARRGKIEIVEDVTPERDAARAEWQWQPARPRPKRLKVVKATNARERFRAAAAKSSAANGQVLSDLTPEQAADKLIAYLRAEKILVDDDEPASD
ncbi:electron transfer flavoprotein subunit beta [Salinicola peritrichatus]|uniref:electron transfer flavoprotein subunit beta n=1 Tax=Salinicola peritrichatus TaxID=1267424 RepID=UPI000DA1985B|nr:electron transfer flavoprotein subunit beta [Salinicola peritrichatus]